MCTDEALFNGLRNGEQDCLVEMVARFHAPLFKYLYRVTGNQQTAEDLVQEAFIRVIKFQGETPVSFKAWAYTIARNLARDYFRSATYRQEASDNMDAEVRLTGSTISTVELAALEADERIEVSRALQRLPNDQREVLVLRFYHDLRLEEIAEITSSPLGTVKSRLYHALKKLKGFLESKEGPVHERAK
ncbi:MAG: sigma-70 family RNA polymerase sigma factor [Anaerolineales bacterium]|nr:sigma-70 family RNA polymerase sigma factor [Anaerolineales bacterium]